MSWRSRSRCSLSVQTAKPGAPLVPNVIEVLGWVALLATWLTGLALMEAASGTYHLYSIRFRNEERRADLQRTKPAGILITQETGERLDPVNEMPVAEENIPTVSERLVEEDERASRRYRRQKRLFVGGLGLLILARGSMVLWS